MLNENSDNPVLTPCEGYTPDAHSSGDSFGEGIDIKPETPESANTTADCPSDAEANASASENQGIEDDAHDGELLGKLPPEIASLLIIAGVAGILLPGPIGMPLLIAGGVTYWPKTFGPIERWFNRRFPAAHREGVIQIKEFIDNLKKRFPDSE